MNSFTTEMMLEIVAALDECDADDAVRAVIFTGAGERAYCAGADLGGGGATFDYDKRRDQAALLPQGAPASPVAKAGTIDWSPQLLRLARANRRASLRARRGQSGAIEVEAVDLNT